MRKLALILFAALAMISALAADTTVNGYLVDIACGTEEGSRPDFGIKHSTACLKMPDCVQSGYGVLTADKKVVKFDVAGNEQAKKFIAVEEEQRRQGQRDRSRERRLHDGQQDRAAVRKPLASGC